MVELFIVQEVDELAILEDVIMLKGDKEINSQGQGQGVVGRNVQEEERIVQGKEKHVAEENVQQQDEGGMEEVKDDKGSDSESVKDVTCDNVWFFCFA
ncbi:hypothetical protein RJT34_22769 [Clitoria ternatea]|uniref:Uncharacterized protein n=1 Tax=Clitoria ternatea TaxID=43366 RepID=A0AAN9FRL3_CLITE